MGEITTDKYNVRQVNEMADRYNGADVVWDEHQTWKAVWICKVRILHAYKRQKTVFQGDMRKAREMIEVLETMNCTTMKPKEASKNKRTADKATQTDDWWTINLSGEQNVAYIKKREEMKKTNAKGNNSKQCKFKS